MERNCTLTKCNFELGIPVLQCTDDVVALRQSVRVIYPLFCEETALIDWPLIVNVKEGVDLSPSLITINVIFTIIANNVIFTIIANNIISINATFHIIAVNTMFYVIITSIKVIIDIIKRETGEQKSKRPKVLKVLKTS